MKAVVIRKFGEIGLAKVETIDKPVPGPRDVLIEIALSPVNFVDSLVFEGKYQFLPEIPFVPGKGPVGTVIAAGSQVSRFRPGDRVLAMAESGGYAQFVSLGEDQCYALPDAMTFDAAASLSLAYDTSWFALVDRGRIEPGQSVLVLGSSGAIGNAAIQIAKAKGATVLAAVSSAARAEPAVKAGADHIIDLSKPDLRDSLREQVYAVTAGRGADIVIDPLGGDFFDAAIRALAWRGRLVVIGFAAGRIATLKTNYLLLKNIEVSGIQVSDYRKRMPDLMRTCFEDLFCLFVAGKIDPQPTVKFTLEQYQQALQGIIDRKVSGRAVLVPQA